MTTRALNQLLSQVISGTVSNTINAFLIDRQSQGISPKTIRVYSQELRYFSNFLDRRGVEKLSELTADIIRHYLVELSTHRNAGGCHVSYRVIKTFTFWWEQETDGEYVSPIRKVKAPRLTVELIAPVAFEDVKAMIGTCDRSLLGLRDKAILLSLLDTGARGSEFVKMSLEDVDLLAGTIMIRFGKGRKYRFVSLGRKSRKALRAYLKRRTDEDPALWVTDEGTKLTFWGLRLIVEFHDPMRALEILTKHLDLVPETVGVTHQIHGFNELLNKIYGEEAKEP